jgi:hypothetical protein
LLLRSPMNKRRTGKNELVRAARSQHGTSKRYTLPASILIKSQTRKKNRENPVLLDFHGFLCLMLIYWLTNSSPLVSSTVRESRTICR